MTDISSGSAQTSSSAIAYEPCVVSFIDVLGFRSLINSRPAAEIYDILTTLRRFTSPEEETPPRSMDEVRVQSRAFAYLVSDAVVRARPYNTTYQDGAFFWELYDLLHAQIGLVGNGVLIRAGVTVGEVYIGINGEGPVFGPGMVRAYEIESQEAIFPRIVIDDHAIEQHQNDPLLRSEDNTLEYEIEAVGRLLGTGEDGTRFIDYLRASRNEFDSFEEYLNFLEQHATLIREGRAEVTDRRTLRKYAWLSCYHNSCIEEIRERVSASTQVDSLLDEEGLTIDLESLIILEQ